MTYEPDDIQHPLDLLTLATAGDEPVFDLVTRDFLLGQHAEFNARLAGGNARVAAMSLGRGLPWLYRLTFQTPGLVRTSDGEIQPVAEHVAQLRFLPDYLRRANRFEMVRLMEPRHVFHPNIDPQQGAICVEIYPGESLLEIVHSLHDLFRWRLRQYDERDALNREACIYGRNHICEPLDHRPLFGRTLHLQLDPLDSHK